MTNNYFYTDANGQRQWASEQNLRTLALQGIITPHTPLETDTGHKGLAGQIPGLFDGIAPSVVASPSAAAPSANAVKPPGASAVSTPNYFYADAYGQKQGPVSPQQLKKLAMQGIITPNTPLETDTGKKGLAG